MKQTIINLLLLLPLLWPAGCSSDEDTNIQPEVKPGDEVQFNIGFGPSTRATTDIAFNTVFEDGDEIGVFALKEGTTDVVAQNVRLVRINGNWVSATDADKIYYPLDGSKLDFYAYYPYLGDHNTTMDNLSFEVKADQSTATNYSKSDLLTAITIGQSNNLGSYLLK
ncbi:MAG: fimbrillin family protein [Paludibacteraceae bacterium]